MDQALGDGLHRRILGRLGEFQHLRMAAHVGRPHPSTDAHRAYRADLLGERREVEA